MAKTVLVLGGYGLVGLPIVKRLIKEGFVVKAVARNRLTGEQLETRCSWIEQDIAKLRTPSAWGPLLVDVDLVVNASGALQSGLSDNVRALQQDSIIALVGACEDLDVEIIQISAPGADANATTEFMRTKAAADQRIRSSSLNWVILKPGVVVAPAAYGGTALLRMLSAVPTFLPIVYADARMTTVSIEDVVDAVLMAVDGRIPAGTQISVVAPEVHDLEGVVLLFRRWLGVPAPVKIFRLPRWFAGIAGLSADGLGWLGWRSPLRSTALRVLEDGVLADAQEYARYAGRPARSLQDTLSEMEATVQERWFAQLYLAFPVLLAVLSGFWLASGIIGLVSLHAAAEHLVVNGFSEGMARLNVVLGSIVDISLGLAVLFRRTARPACFGMIAVTLTYLAAGTFLSPELWVDPLGPFVKTIPAAALAWVASILVKTR
jgi:uncharacterized protein YbjT (DUF2867 family)